MAQKDHEHDDGTAAGSAGPDDLERDEAREGRTSDVTEGEVRAAADAAATTRLAGHNATLALYEQTEEGQRFIEEEAPRRAKEAEEENQRVEEQTRRSNAAIEEYQRRVQAQAQQTRAVRDAAQEAVAEKAEDDDARSTSDRIPQSAAKSEGSSKKSTAR